LFVKSDIVVTDEARSDETRHAQFQPTLLAEVTSYSTRKTDMVDKLIQYQKFPSLKYYLIVEQDKEEVIVISRNAEGNCKAKHLINPIQI
jgi:Uma2 family endonuclease